MTTETINTVIVTNSENQVIGKPVSRVDGRLKITGAATYTAEYHIPNLAHAVIVSSAVSKGKILRIESAEALSVPGVLRVITHENLPRTGKAGSALAVGTVPGETRAPLEDNQIHHAGQHIAVVVAETLEAAEHAAHLVRVEYERETPKIDLETERANAEHPKTFYLMPEELQVERGNAKQAFESAPVKIAETYQTPNEHQNPIEPHATIAVWDNENITIYDSTQAVIGAQKVFAGLLGLKEENVRVVAKFVGGGFGSKGLIWMHGLLAAIAAKELGRPVKLTLSRQQMFMTVGHRGETVQRVCLGASETGELQSIEHETDTHASFIGEFHEPPGLVTTLLYQCENVKIAHNVMRLNVGTPCPMRAPGESPGTYALESAMDELAFALKIDPVELRLKNHADINPKLNRPWSSKHLKECYRLGAEKIGWANRQFEPRSIRENNYLIGYGMATATYPGYRSPASALARMFDDGTVFAAAATQDIGTGTYTAMSQIAADAFGISLDRVRFELGDSSFPTAPTSGGSATVASVAPAVAEACEIIRLEITRMAVNDHLSPLFECPLERIEFGDNRLYLKEEPARGETYSQILRRNNRPIVEACVTANTASQEAEQEARNPAVKASTNNRSGNGRGNFQRPLCHPLAPDKDVDANMSEHAFQSFGAQFARVRVDEDLGIVRVTNFVSVLDVGRIINEETARSQARSGVIMGIGMALMEETVYDPNNARPVVRTLADYHFPAHLDVPQIDVHLLDIPDPHINALGARGVGEIGITGVAAAIANAVFNATGKRVRDLPITPDKLF